MTERTYSRWNWAGLAVASMIAVLLASVPTAAGGGEPPVRAKPGKPSPRGSVNFSDLEAREKELPPLRLKGKSKPQLPSHGRPRGRPVPTEYLSSEAAAPDTNTLVSASAAALTFEATALDTPPLTASFGALLDNGLPGTFNPDTQGAVGPNHLMVALNTEVRVQSREGGVIQTVSLDGFWASIGASNVFDPRLLYDPYGNRWIMSAEADPGGNNPLVLLGVSRSSDPTGQWFLYGIDVDADSPRYAEAPNLGFNKNWIVVQADLFNNVDFLFETSDLYVFTKSDVYANGPNSNYRVLSLNGAADVATHVPAATYDPDVETLYVMANYNANFNGAGYLQTLAISGPIGNETIASLAFPEAAAWADFIPNFADILPQLGTARKIFAGDARLANVVYREGTLFTTHTVFAPADAPTRAGIQWWEVSPGGRIPKQFSRLADPANELHYAYPSIAVNRDLDVLLGFNRFWAERYASAFYAYRSGTDTPNTIRPITAQNLLKLGEATYVKTNYYGNNVWGNWSSTVVDPINDTEMWTLQEYAAARVDGLSRWGTWWGRVTPDVDLAISGNTSATEVTAGTPVTYNLFITNLLENRVEGVYLTNNLPLGAAFVSATPSQGSCSHSAGQVVCDIGRMEDLATASVTIVASPSNIGQSTNIAGLAARGPDIAPANNTLASVVTVRPSADVGVTLSATPNPVNVGATLTVTVRVTNAGPSAATGVIVTNMLPANVAFVSATPSVGSFVRSGANGIWTLNSLAIGANPTLTMFLRPTNNGSVITESLVRATSIDPEPANNSATHVARANAIPTLSFLATRIVSEDVTGAVDFTIGDAETPPDNLTVTLTSSNPLLVPSTNLVLTRNGANCSLMIIPLPNQFGSTAIRRTVTDSDGASVTSLFTNTVRAVNDPPTINPLSNIAVAEDSGARAVPLTGITGGPSNEPQTTTVSATSSAPGIVPHPAVTAVSGGSSTLTFTPAANAFGTATITINVNDGGLSNNITTATFDVTVVGVNDPPTLNQPPTALNLSEDAPVQTINLTGIGPGNANETDTVNITVSQSDPAVLENLTVNYSGGTSGSLTFNPVPNASGSSVVTIRADDNMPSNNIVTRMFTVNVSSVNDPPTISAPGDLTILEDAGPQSVALSNISSGAANETQTLTVTPTTGSPGLIGNLAVNYSSPASSGVLTFSTQPNANGNGSITLTVRDDGASNNVTTHLIAVNITPVNDAPTLNAISPLTIPEDSPLQRITLSGISAGAPNETSQTITFSAVSSDPSIIPDPVVLYTNGQTTASLRFTPVHNATGTATITVTGVDSGGTASGGQDRVVQPFTVTVEPVNDLPTITDIANRTIPEDGTANFPFQVGDSETAAANLNVTVQSSHPVLLPASGLMLGGSGGDRFLDVAPAPDQFGTVTNRITVTDADNGSAVEEFVLTVSPVNDPPTVNPLPPLNVREGSGTQVVVFTGVSAGPPNEPQNLTITASSSATGVIPTPTVSYTNGQSTGVLRFTPVLGVSGTATITLRLNDGGSSNNITLVAFDVNVNNIQGPPTITEIPAQTMLEDAELTVPFTVGDPDTPLQALILSAQSFNEEVIATADLSFGGFGADRTLIIRPLPEQSGSGFVAVTVSDGSSPVTVSFEVVVQAVNDPPAFSAIANQNMAENSSRTVFFTLTDAESLGDSLSLGVSSDNATLLPAGSLVLGQTSSNRSLTITPAAFQFGTATIRLTASDGETNSVRSFTLTVTHSNEPPTISAFGDITIDEDTGTGPLPFAISDPETAAGNLTISAQSSIPAIIPISNIAFGGSGFTRTITVTPAANQFGSSTITINVGDGTSVSSKQFVVNVQPINDPPTLNTINNVTIAEDAGLQTIQLSGISAGAANEGQIVTITASSSNPDLVATVNVNYTNPSTTGSLTFTPLANASGSAVITVTVSDGQATTSRTFTVTVNPAADPPSIGSIANQLTSEDTPLTTTFTISDPDTPLMSVSVTAVSTNTALVANTNIFVSGEGTTRTVTVVPSPNQSGVTRITLTANDGSGTASNSFLLNVSAVNDPPTLNPLTNTFLSVSPGTVSLPLSGITSGAANESDTISITVSNSNPALFLNAPAVSYTSPNQTGTLSFRPANNQSGSAIITLTVNDNRASNNISRRSFTLGVKPNNNNTPTVSGITSRSTSEDTSVTIPFTVGDAETPAGSLTVSAISLNPSLLPNSNTNIVFGGSGASRSVTLTPVPNASGNAGVILTVLDGNSGGVNASLTLTVTPVNDTPVISSIANQSLNEDASSAAIPFTVGDVETAAGNLMITASSANTSLIPNTGILLGGSGTNRALSITPNPNQSGSALITVTVSDGAATSNAMFTVTVNPINDPPVVSTVADQSITEDTATTALPFIIGDAETPATALSITPRSSNQTLVPNSAIEIGGAGANRTVTVTPLPNQFGLTTISLDVSDGTTTTSTSFKLTVVPANDPPTLNAIGDVSIGRGTANFVVNLAGITCGPGEAQGLIVSASSSNPGIIAHPVVNYTSPNATGTLLLTASSQSDGSAVITVTVSDAQMNNSTITRNFSVTVIDGAAPRLQLLRNGSNVDVSWPIDSGDYVLQRAAMVGGAWIDITTPSFVLGDRNVVRESASQAARFYRLRFRSGGLSEPSLAIALDGVNVAVSWPATATNYVLEAQNGFGAAWGEVTATPNTIGSRKVVLESRSQARRFYRLRRQ